MAIKTKKNVLKIKIILFLFIDKANNNSQLPQVLVDQVGEPVLL